jgi:hypothetical protein
MSGDGQDDRIHAVRRRCIEDRAIKQIAESSEVASFGVRLLAPVLVNPKMVELLTEEVPSLLHDLEERLA